MSTGGGEIDDPVTALLAHVRNHPGREPNGTHQIEFEAVAPFLVGGIEGMAQLRIAGVVDQDIGRDRR